MVDYERDKKEKLGKEETGDTTAAESAVAYNFRQRERESKGMAGASQVAAASEEGDDMDQRYFEKYIDQRMANIDEKFLAIKEENVRIREDLQSATVDFKKELQDSVAGIQRTIDQSLTARKEQEEQRQIEMRERDNQRHAEIRAANAKTDAILAEIRADFRAMDAKMDTKFNAMGEKVDNTNRWVTSFVIAALLSLAALVFTNFWVVFGR